MSESTVDLCTQAIPVSETLWGKSPQFGWDIYGSNFFSCQAINHSVKWVSSEKVELPTKPRISFAQVMRVNLHTLFLSECLTEFFFHSETPRCLRLRLPREGGDAVYLSRRLFPKVSYIFGYLLRLFIRPNVTCETNILYLGHSLFSSRFKALDNILIHEMLFNFLFMNFC